MILGRELPAWKQIAGNVNTTEKPFMASDGTLLFAESCQSLKAVINAVKEVRGKNELTLWMPDYFCNQTLACFREEWLNVVYYPIDENLNPDWALIRGYMKQLKEGHSFDSTGTQRPPENVDSCAPAESALSADFTSSAPDIFLFVHYFGVAHDISKARDFCNNNSVILIEDCAHCLYPHPLGVIGQKGDFVIYSQHKQLPISDGAVLKINSDATKTDMRDEIAKVADEVGQIHEAAPKRGNMNGWYQKKAVQKLAPFVHRGLTYSFNTHFGDERIRDYPIEKISDKSYSILAGYSYEDYKRIAYIRRDNLRVTNEAVMERIPEIVVLNEPNDYETPYMGVYSLRNLKDEEKESAVKRLIDEDFTVLYWPDLPYDLVSENIEFDDHSRAYKLSRDIFVIPAIHQDVRPQQLVKKFLHGASSISNGAADINKPTEAGPISILHEKNCDKQDVRIAKLYLVWQLSDNSASVELPLAPKKSQEVNPTLAESDNSASAELHSDDFFGGRGNSVLAEDSQFESEWARIFERAATTNIPQDYIYGDAKSVTEGWGLKRALVKNEGDETVGVLQVLIKKVKGISVAARVNRGPVLLAEYDCVENHIAVMRELRKTIRKPMPIAWAPFVVWTVDNLRALTAAGWKCTDPYAYPSGYLDLSQSEEELEKNMQPFWRKHLKQAKKQVDIQINHYSASEVRALYAQFLRMKDIPGIPDAIIEYLFNYMQSDMSASIGLPLPQKKSSEDNPTPDALGYNILEVLTAHNKDGAMIAYKVLYRHGNTGTSFIAWNTDEGRDKQARTYLIFESALRLKELGCKFYDLGGIDDITTEAVAKFKRGTGDTDYRLLGEFINAV